MHTLCKLNPTVPFVKRRLGMQRGILSVDGMLWPDMTLPVDAIDIVPSSSHCKLRHVHSTQGGYMQTQLQ